MFKCNQCGNIWEDYQLDLDYEGPICPCCEESWCMEEIEDEEFEKL